MKFAETYSRVIVADEDAALAMRCACEMPQFFADVLEAVVAIDSEGFIKASRHIMPHEDGGDGVAGVLPADGRRRRRRARAVCL